MDGLDVDISKDGDIWARAPFFLRGVWVPEYLAKHLDVVDMFFALGVPQIAYMFLSNGTRPAFSLPSAIARHTRKPALCPARSKRAVRFRSLTLSEPTMLPQADHLEIYFHSDSSNNEWGVKLYVYGIMQVHERRER